jgi:HEAT repeat protein
MKTIKISACLLLLFGLAAERQLAAQNGKPAVSIKQTLEEYKSTNDKKLRKDIRSRLEKLTPSTNDDVARLRTVFDDKEFDEGMYSSALKVLPKIENPQLSDSLLPMLNDDKSFVGKVNKGDPSILSEKKNMYRLKKTEYLIKTLGKLKSKAAVPLLKEYLNFPNMQYAVSEALGAIGDKSMDNEIREKAYRGEQINYAGMGAEEAKQVAKDLGDSANKPKWMNMAKQLALVKEPSAKPELKKLFSHDDGFVRLQAAMAFSRMADDTDAATVLEMTKNSDWNIRATAIDAIKKTKSKQYDDVLISLLDDSDYLVRLYAAKALGYKKIIKAIPNLEKSLTDKDLKVREEAYIALYTLTGKKYSYEGKTPLVERRAERQKDHPSFY